jgi:hypothetical protein
LAGRFAVADGASESIFAGEWARMLCEGFVADRAVARKVGPWLTLAKERWRALGGDRPVPWHVAEKLEDGAFATFLGVCVEAGRKSAARWDAVAVGDTCLFLVEGDTLRGAFPVEQAGAFGTRPQLVGSRQWSRVGVARARGTLAAGARLLAMTDALAEWFLAEHEAGRAPWRELGLLTETSFPAWVDARRADRGLKNDDVTLLVIELANPTM